ncbi:hypothetical protein MJO28_000446 [Puccinia striiformis f. sp. tritici]|uniref:Uncharacterized protein n=3 Tax=Puccinia striiformis TaxID=27350 RepID=A0A2S4VZC3_9BASI|nr:hypothetical protein MJO28_000446 [Puccinia striiformis f. sp. tritici]KAI7967509.1 hypothetical protein MJO29_000786 [Puccinia striiformis f. sp. tritici]POW14866.1 hypothetical protein PSHT_07244 [Puccinia striiformis]POW14901.1 hypothetical protein PSTT_02543 [Puccinia striiformis]
MLLVLAIIALIAFPSGLIAPSSQFCGKYFAPSPKVPGHHDCDNPALKPYRCKTDSCGDGKGDETVHYRSFFAFPESNYLDAIDFSGVRYLCRWDDVNTFNERRPQCDSCEPRK